jgi:hypothetical protein
MSNKGMKSLFNEKELKDLDDPSVKDIQEFEEKAKGQTGLVGFKLR